MRSSRGVSHEVPTVIREHVDIPASVVSFFHRGDVLMEPLPLFVTHSSEIRGKFIEMTMEVMELDTHAALQCSEILQHVLCSYRRDGSQENSQRLKRKTATQSLPLRSLS